MNIIFGVYSGYNSLKTHGGGIYYFFKSLRKYSDCKVVVVCEKNKVFADLVHFSNEMNFEIYSDFDDRYNNNIVYNIYNRYEIYKKYMKESNLVFDKVFLLDMNDVIFQDDPFSIDFTEDLYCALEQSILSDTTNSSSILNMEWINQCNHLSKNNYGSYINKYVVCAGTILGTYNGVVNFMEFFSKNYISNNHRFTDQGVLNVYVYNYLESKKCIELKESKILTLDKVMFETLNIENNSIVNNKGEKYCILHQINRCNLPFMLSLA